MFRWSGPVALLVSLAVSGCAGTAPVQPSPNPSAPLRVNIYGTPTRNQPTEVGLTIPSDSGDAAIAQIGVEWGDGSSSELQKMEPGREYVLAHVYTTSRTHTMTVAITYRDQRQDHVSFIVPVR